jgi:hypothetical protein
MSLKTPSRLRENTERYRKGKIGLLTNLYHKMKNRKGVDFSLAYFKEHMLHYWKFNFLFRQWVNYGYQKEFKPSIDRINFRLPYTRGNLRLVTWGENRQKGDIECAIQKMKPVIMMCRNGKFVCQFDSIASAVYITGYNQGLISACCLGKRNRTGDFKFKFGNIYENPELLEANE